MTSLRNDLPSCCKAGKGGETLHNITMRWAADDCQSYQMKCSILVSGRGRRTEKKQGERNN
ncbi:hypothetical protein HPP92_017091 [Vanilla planifolia]|uniref:Uncharacterized protein n=1 Tax=Vanilla planifolia TaxID=51239 RepID=A0A835QC41_VANPL|nr:hypothetical protein HPP92_017091 [Vanilla planifolia]